MSDQTRFTFCLSSTLKRSIEEASHDAHVSQAELARSILRDSILEGDSVEIPSHLTQKLERERAKERNELVWQRIHFPSNVADRFRRAFEQGDLNGEVNPGAIDELRQIHIEDAEILYDDENQQDAIDFVNAVADHAADAQDASEFDRLDPEQMFEAYSGVEDGRSRGSIDPTEFEAIVADAQRRLNDPTKSVKPDDRLVTALSNMHQVPETVAKDAVEAAADDAEVSR